MMAIEIQILDWLQKIHSPVGDTLMAWITGLGDNGILWILLAVLLLCIPKTRKSGLILMMALCVDVILCNGILKNLFSRTRPFDVNPSVQLLISRPKDFSFPSGHTAASFASVMALYLAGEKSLWKPALVVAVLIAFSRMYFYVHFPTDILGGIIVGLCSGYIGYRIVEKVRKSRFRKKEF